VSALAGNVLRRRNVNRSARRMGADRRAKCSPTCEHFVLPAMTAEGGPDSPIGEDYPSLFVIFVRRVADTRCWLLPFCSLNRGGAEREREATFHCRGDGETNGK
jgi:hypothetical protein